MLNELSSHQNHKPDEPISRVLRLFHYAITTKTKRVDHIFSRLFHTDSGHEINLNQSSATYISSHEETFVYFYLEIFLDFYNCLRGICNYLMEETEGQSRLP